jgi:hypothetical protein
MYPQAAVQVWSLWRGKPYLELTYYGTNNLAHTPHQPKPGKAGHYLVLLAQYTIFFSDAPSPYCNTVRSASRREIAYGAQVRWPYRAIRTYEKFFFSAFCLLYSALFDVQ